MPDYDDDRRPDDRAPDAAGAKSLAVPPGIILILVRVLLVGYAAYGILTHDPAKATAELDKQKAVIDANPNLPADQKKAQKDMMDTVGNVTVSAIQPFLAVTVGASLVIILAGVCMATGKAWGFAVFGAVLSCVPCLDPVCLPTFPFGVWALIVLTRPRVRAAFRRPPPGPADDFDRRDER